MSWLKIKKLVILTCHLLLLYTTTMNHFSIRLWHVTKSGFYMTTGDNQLRGWTEKIPSISLSQTCTNKGHGHSWSAACLIHYNFLNPSQTITSEKYAQHINEMHQKQQCPQPALVKRKGFFSVQHPIAHRTTNTSKVEQIGLWGFASSVTFTWPLTNWLPLLQASI